MYHTKMPLNAIRAMDLYDFQMHLRLALVRERIEREFRIQLAGGTVGTKKKVKSADEILGKDQVRKGGGVKRFTKHQRFDPATNSYVDT